MKVLLEKLYYDLKLNETCKKISEEYRIKYDLNKILQDLVYTRIIEPCSKSSSFEVAKKFIEQPDYEITTDKNMKKILKNIKK